MLDPQLSNLLAEEIETEMEWEQTSSAPILDDAILNSQKAKEPSFYPNISRFLDRLHSELQHVSQLLRQGDETYAMELAHQMQYDAQAYGLMALSNAWVQLTDSLQLGISMDGVDYITSDVEHAYHRTVEALKVHQMDVKT